MTYEKDKKTSGSADADTGMTLFRLFVADDTIASGLAMNNLQEICDRNLNGPYQVEVVDILVEPLRSLSEGVIVTPTLLRVSPKPVRTIVGDLSNTQAVLDTLGLRSEGDYEKK